MSHQFIEGFFSNNQPAWHGLGKVLPAGQFPDKAEAMRLAGHDWKVVEQPVYADGKELVNFKALFTDKGQHISVVNRTCTTIQNEVFYDLVEAVATQGIKWDAGVTLQDWKCAIVGHLNEPWTAPGDNTPTFPFLTGHWGHDGKTAGKMLRTSIRTVCANTFGAAESESEKTGYFISIRHTKNFEDYVEKAKATLMQLRSAFDQYKELATELAHITVSEAQVKTFLEQFLPMPDASEVSYSERVRNNVVDARAAVEYILDGRNGTNTDVHRRTAYGLWQSGLEYLQHTRKARTAYSKFGRSILREERVAENLHRLVLSISR